ncbi:hypothetical protein ACFWGD_07460 [Corynebacterium sp. NPDC060344]|uniref:hypothetical protein n=1 Tax=Corynebacterium sp. NPDC060344 TaxID=3347101 RepID=UPI00364FA78D
MSLRISAQARRNMLVEAALEIAAEEGAKAIRTRSVCARANAHLSVFHYCFDGKNELFAMMTKRLLAELGEGFDSEEIVDLRGFMHTATKLMAESWSHTLTLYELVVASARESDGEKERLRHFQTFIDNVEDFLRLYAQAGGFTWSVDTRVIAGLIVSFLGGTGLGWVADGVKTPAHDPQSAEVETFITLIESLKAPGGDAAMDASI